MPSRSKNSQVLLHCAIEAELDDEKTELQMGDWFLLTSVGVDQFTVVVSRILDPPGSQVA